MWRYASICLFDGSFICSNNLVLYDICITQIIITSAENVSVFLQELPQLLPLNFRHVNIAQINVHQMPIFIIIPQEKFPRSILLFFILHLKLLCNNFSTMNFCYLLASLEINWSTCIVSHLKFYHAFLQN